MWKEKKLDCIIYEIICSGWQILWLKLNPFSSMPKIPSQADIQLRLAYVSCVRQLEEVRTASYCDYIRPPIDKYGILQFEAFEEIRDVGYHHGKVRILIFLIYIH